MKLKKKPLIYLLFGLLFLLFSMNVSAQQLENFRVGITGDESTLTPFTYVTGNPGWNLLMMQYDSLFTVDVNKEPQPWLVKDWSKSKDGRSYTLHLREDVWWHDGKAFTAEDVKFTFEYFTQNTTASSRFTKEIRGFASAEVKGKFQVVIHLKKENLSYVRKAFSDVPILPMHIWKKITDPKNHQFKTITNVGTGPFQLKEYKPNQFYRFKANPKYFAGLPTVKNLIVIQFANTAGSLAAFRTREIDMPLHSIPPEQIGLFGMTKGVSIMQGALYTTQLLLMNYDVKPFHLVEVRKALALAIDRQDLVNTIYLGRATKGSLGWIHPNSPFANQKISTEFNPEKAKVLLDRVGVMDSNGDGVREYQGKDMLFQLISPNGSPLIIRSAELIQEMLAKIGIKLAVEVVEQATWEDKVWPEFDVKNGRKYQMSMWGWSAGIQVDASRISALTHSNPDIGFLNLTGTANKEIDSLTQRMEEENNPEAYKKLVKKAQVSVAEEIPFISLMHPDGNYAYWSSVYDNLAFIKGQGPSNKLSFLPKESRP